jgi:tetratricopeptide (TPR) repeat protein
VTRWIRLAWPLAALVLFVAVLRGPRGPGGDGEAVDCATVLATIQAAEQCLATQPDNIELMTDLGALLERGGRIDEAEALYRRALSIDPRDGDVRLKLGTLLLGRGDAAGARREAAAALEIRPGSAAALRLSEQAAAPGILEPAR